ncbi:SRPBCC family protein [Acuticoccus sp.]|uniref:SRPBCC family protein n=1 Tax=Acuticoccus sp. TaxID=1904378 RepID=UPI003B5182F4
MKVLVSTVIDAPPEAVWEVVRDFNGHDAWTPAVTDSAMERGAPTDRVSGVRRFHLADGSELREQLLTLSDADMTLSYCLLDTPIPLFNYVAHVRLLPVTDGDMTFWQWQSRFDTPAGRERELAHLVREDIYTSAMNGLRERLRGASA